jgi:hypothetical protein
MSETDENQKEQKPKISALIKWALILTAIGSLSIMSLRYAEGLALLGLFVFMPLAFVFSIISLAHIKKSQGKLKGKGLIIAAILVQLALAAPFGYSVTTENIVRRICCRCCLTGLREAMFAYANDNDDKYPTPDKWCNLLLEHDKSSERLFCKAAMAKGGQKICHYVLNPNCQPNSPNDVVLLFETKGGWNQFGGQEMLNTNNNYKNGWRVLFNDGHIEFIEPHELAKLKW